MRNKTQRNWSKEEFLVVLNLYFKLPFGKMHSRNNEVIETAHLIDRTPNSVAMRLVTFASVDPYHKNRGIKGLSGGKRQCELIFNEFVNDRENLVFETEKIIATKEFTTIENKFDILLGVGWQLKQGEDKILELKTRVNQNYFRQIVLSNYNSKCAISSIDLPEILIAAHIMPWATNQSERLNPENGICFANLYEKAFDVGYFGINSDYKIVLSPVLKLKSTKEYYDDIFGKYEQRTINLPEKYLPNLTFLEHHLTSVFMH